jgi:YebC/PmpR family DNA-binding regulatory protein
MAGHSKWSQIKRTKAVVDARRGAVFTRLGREITVAARAGGDPAGNFQLRTAIEKARAAGMPNVNIERAIAKGSGRGDGDGPALESVRYEGYGPGGLAVLVEAFTDNRNRTAAEMRLAFSKNGGNLGESGCVGYLFDLRGVVRVDGGCLQEEALLESLLELEVTGYSLDREGADVFCAPAHLEALQGSLSRQGWIVAGCDLRWQAHTACRLGDLETLRATLRMLEALDELDDVRSVSSNLEADEELLVAAMG